MQKELTQIVEGMISGGAFSHLSETCRKKFRITKYNRVEFYMPEVKSSGVLIHYDEILDSYSISDLLSSHPAMLALLGEKTYWEETSDEYGLGTCYDTGIPAFIYHIQQAFTLPTDQERVEYMHGVWKGEK